MAVYFILTIFTNIESSIAKIYEDLYWLSPENNTWPFEQTFIYVMCCLLKFSSCFCFIGIFSCYLFR